MLETINETLISVVIPVYNRVHCIENAIATVQAQVGFQPGQIEIVVVEDGSKDGTSELLSKLQKNDPYLKVIRHPENRGVSAARNTGIRESNGHFIAFLDSDDTWYPEKLIRQFNEVVSPHYFTLLDDMIEKGQYPDPEDPLVQSMPDFTKIFCMTYYDRKYKNGDIDIPSHFYEVDKENIAQPKIYTPEELRRGTVTLSKWFGVGSTLFAHRSAIERASEDGVLFKEGFGFGEDSEPLVRHVLRGGDIKVVPQLLMTYTLPEHDKVYPAWHKRYAYMSEKYRCDIAIQFDPDAAIEFIRNLRKIHQYQASVIGGWKETSYELTVKLDSPCMTSEFNCKLYGKICKPIGQDPGSEWADDRALWKAITPPSIAHQIELLESIIGAPLVAQAFGVTKRTVQAWRSEKQKPHFTKKLKIQLALQLALYMQARGIEQRGHSIAGWFVEPNPALDGMSPVKAMQIREDDTPFLLYSPHVFRASRDFCDALPGAYRPLEVVRAEIKVMAAGL